MNLTISDKKLNDSQHLFILGAQRSGSSWLYELLDSHPDIFMNKPRHPEPKFFLERSADLRTYRAEVFPDLNEDYLYLGEKSTSYYESPEAVGNIIDSLGRPKCLLILRNPIYRALSNYKFSVVHGVENRSLEEVFVHGAQPPKYSQKISVNPFDYLSRGNYAKHLVPLLDLLGPQLKVVILEEVIRSEGSLDEIWQFLGIEPSAVIPNRLNTTQPLNVSVEVIEALKVYYQKPVEVLESLLDRKLDIWR